MSHCSWRASIWFLSLNSIGCSSNADPPAVDAQPADIAVSDRPTAPDAPPAADAAVDVARDGDQVPPVQFPRDEAPHSESMEWWYYTGMLLADSGETYGFEQVIFQVLHGGVLSYMAHFAITDQKQGTFNLDTKTSFDDQRGATSGFDLTVGGWKMSGHAGNDQLRADMPGYALELTLAAQKPVVLQYGKGWMTVGSEEPFYYYSYTRMAATGSLTVDGEEKSVTGEAWMDHQWGTLGSGYEGWDWYSLRLDDNTEVMLFVVRRPGQQDFTGGTFADAGGYAEELASSDFSITAMGQWTSPHTQATYPQGWRITSQTADLDVTVTPVMADQEFHESVFGSPVYWEGLCTIAGTRQGKQVQDHAYVELTNYN